VPTEKLPDKPKIEVPLYPDQNAWYNVTPNFLAQWGLPPDISDVATALNKDKAYVPPPRSEGLFEAKTFPTLTDGIWYLHVRFKNNVGWGPAAHFRTAIDTTPPEPFTIESSEGATPTDNPTPTIRFTANDGLSGIRRYFIQVDGAEVISQEKDSLTLSPQAPGKQTVFVKAVDNAGNIRENSIELNILPIASPAITFIQKDLLIGEGGLFVSGTTLPGVTVLISLKNNRGLTIAEINEKPDAAGNWHGLFDVPLKNGTYFIEAKIQDSRGAQSLPVKSDLVTVREKPLFTMAGIEITQFWFYTFTSLLFLGAILAGWLWYRQRRKKADKKMAIAQRDVVNLFMTTRKDIDGMLKNYADGRIDDREAAEMEFVLKEIKSNLEKMEKYIIENIGEIND